MDLFIQLLITGVMVGSIYALVALGWTLIYKCSGVLNLAMGELTLIGAYVCLSFYTWGIPFPLAVVGMLIIGFILGLLTERLFLRRMVGESVLAVIMVTTGLSFFFRGIVVIVWGADTQVFTPPVFSAEPIRWGKIVLGQVYVWSFVAALVMLMVFVGFFKYTRWGLSMQATADDEMAALSLGVSAHRVYALAWAIAFMAAGVGGTLLGNINGLNISVGYLGLLVLPAVVLGGAELRSGGHRWRDRHRRPPEPFGWVSEPAHSGRDQGNRPLRLHDHHPVVPALRVVGLGEDRARLTTRSLNEKWKTDPPLAEKPGSANHRGWRMPSPCISLLNCRLSLLH